MKRVFNVLITMVMLSIISTSVFAHDHAAETEEVPTIGNGHVYDADGSTPVSGVEVIATCYDSDSELVTELSSITNDKGFWLIEYEAGDCSLGSEITVTAGTSEVKHYVAKNLFVKNVFYGNLQVPEFSFFGVIGTLLGGLVIFMGMRKR